ncbi:DUF2218 domain-containing protein [Mycolicibacterium frederiksbergense]
MPTVEARVATDRASRYLTQLCRHANQMRVMSVHPSERGGPMPPRIERVDYTDTVGSVYFAEGTLTLQAGADVLVLRLEAADHECLCRLEDAVAARLQTIGRRDCVTVDWQGLGVLPIVTDGEADREALSGGPGVGRPWWRSRLGWSGLAAVGVAAHVGLGGTAIAAATWTGWVGNTVMLIILATMVVLVAHLGMRRYGGLGGVAMHAGRRKRHRRSGVRSASDPGEAPPPSAVQRRP